MLGCLVCSFLFRFLLFYFLEEKGVGGHVVQRSVCGLDEDILGEQIQFYSFWQYCMYRDNNGRTIRTSVNFTVTSMFMYL